MSTQELGSRLIFILLASSDFGVAHVIFTHTPREISHKHMTKDRLIHSKLKVSNW